MNRLKSILPELISQEQTGFIKGRQTVDDIIVAQEAIHSLKNSKHKGMMIKLDLAKAYDRLSWEYLQKILKSYGFDDRWIDWVMSMITMPIMSILLNRTPIEAFNPSKGFRQGDPLSPFLFILVVDGLGRMIKARVNSGQLKRLRLWGEELPLTHQQFVDDVMLYGQANLKEAKQLMEILGEFTKAIGTEISKDKS